MRHEDKVAKAAARKSTLKSLAAKKRERIKQIKEQYEEELREANIKFANDPERLRAKYAAGSYAKSERERRDADKKIAREKDRIEFDSNMRRPSVGEEIFSGLVQGVGAVCSIAALTIIMYKAAMLPASAFDLPIPFPKPTFIATFACFGGSMIVMYIMSTLHHALVPDGAKEVFDRLTRDFVFLTIAAAYTSFTLTSLCSPSGWVIFGIVWAMAVCGIVLYSIYGRQFALANIILYLVIGWSALFVVNQLYHALPAKSFLFLIVGGVAHTIGCVFLLFPKIKFMHSIGDLFMLMGSVYLFLVMAFEIL